MSSMCPVHTSVGATCGSGACPSRCVLDAHLQNKYIKRQSFYSYGERFVLLLSALSSLLRTSFTVGKIC